MSQNQLPINRSEQFSNLPNAPIVEAVLHWQAPASRKYQSADLSERLRVAFPDYALNDQHNFEAGFVGAEGGVEFKQRSAWQGVRLTRQQDGHDKFVCQFLRQGVVFSQLTPYAGWEEFSTEAKKFWDKHLELGNPVEVARMSVRFISQVPIESVTEIEKYVAAPPKPIPGLNLSTNHFLYQDSIELSDSPYVINTVRAVQPAQETGLSLIVDIDVLTSQGFEPQEVDEKLLDLRFIKNKVFFSIMNDAEQSFGATQ